TETYQRKLGSKPHWDSPSFAMASPSRLRGDQIFDSLNTVLGVDLEQISPNRGQGSLARVFGARSQFNQVFGHDPSTPQDELTGTVPQALFLMNSPLINNLISTRNNTRLAQILNTYDDDEDVIAEVYLLVLSRAPTSQEITICKDYL